MDAEKFEARARSCRSREELEALRANAMAKGAVELAHIAEEALRCSTAHDERHCLRFP